MGACSALRIQTEPTAGARRLLLIERMTVSLGERGTELMPLDEYGFSQRFCWVADGYGVTWQLNLPYGVE